MKVHIGPYRDWIGPYQISEMLLFWEPKYIDGKLMHHNPRIHDFGTWLATDGKGGDSWLTKLCEWIHSKKHRKVKIKIDRWDSWNAHNTASLILLPLFKQLHENNHGSGWVEDSDVPENLRSHNARPLEENDVWDDLNHARWNYVMGEILFALEADNSDWEEQFTHEDAEIDWSEHPEDVGKTCIPIRWKKEGKYDWEGKRKYQERITNGFRLMGVYWQNLWD